MDSATTDKNSAGAAALRQRLPGRVASALARLRHWPDRLETAAEVLAAMPMVAALEELCRRLGKPTTRAHLTAALPVGNGELAPQFVPIALARTGLQARWQRLPIARLAADDLPALARLREGGALLVLAVGRHSATICDMAGSREVDLAALQPQLDSEILACGHVDPENGLDDEGERELLRRNPRLWLLGAYLGERRRLGQLILASLVLNLCGLTIPLYMRAIYDRVVPNLAVESLWALSTGVVLALIFELLLDLALWHRLAPNMPHDCAVLASFDHAKNGMNYPWPASATGNLPIFCCFGGCRSNSTSAKHIRAITLMSQKSST